MRIFITGGSGVLGRRLIERFAASGHSVKALSRSEKADQAIRAPGGNPYRGDHFDSHSLSRYAEGSDVVIHAATSIPSSIRYSAKDWEMNDRLRREGTHALTEAAGRIEAKLYIQQSIVWVARPVDQSFFNEDTQANPTAVYASSLDAENIAFEAGRRYGFRVIVLRCGLFYSADSIHTKMFGETLRKKTVRIVGSGNAIWAIVHSDDAASAFVLAAESQRSGLWHIVDDQPVTVKDFFSEFARQLGAPPPKHAPVWLAKLLLGKETTEFFTTSTRTSNERFRKDFGWSPRFPDYRKGLGQVVEEWNQKK